MKTAGDSEGDAVRAQGAFLRWLPAIAVLYACALALLLARQPDVVGLMHDDGVYFSMARSVEHGLGPVDSHLPTGAHTNRFPPAYPLVLALARPLLGVDRDGLGGVHRLVALNALWLGIALAAFLRWVTRWKRWPPWLALASALLVFTLPCVVGLAQHLMSESLLLAELGVVLLLVERAAAAGAAKSSLVAGLVSGAMAATKTAAAPIVVGLALFLLVRRRSWRAAAAFAIAALVPWIAATAWSAASRAVDRESPLFGPPYLHLFVENLGRLPQVVAVNAVRFADLAVTLFVPNLPAASGTGTALLRVALVLQVVVALVVGSWLACRRRRELDRREPDDGGAPSGAELFVLASYVLALLAWPFADLRFLVPIGGVALVAYVEAVRGGLGEAVRDATTARVGTRRVTSICAIATRRVASIAPCLLFALASVNSAKFTSKCFAARGELDEAPFFWAEPVKLAPLRETAAWLARETRNDEVFASTLDSLLTPMCGRAGVSSWRDDLPFAETYLDRGEQWRELFGSIALPRSALHRLRSFSGSVVDEYRRLGVRHVVVVRGGAPGRPLHEALVDQLVRLDAATKNSFERVFTTSDGSIDVWRVRGP